MKVRDPKILLTCFVLAGSVYLMGQNTIQPLTDLQIFGTSTFEFRNKELSIKDIQGTPYLVDEFFEGRVLMGNVLYEGVLLRYNIYGDRFEVMLEQNTIELDPVTNNIDTFYYAGHKFVRKFLESEKNRELVHLAVLFDQPACTLFKKHNVTLIPEKQPGAYASAQPAKFDPEQPDYYLGKGDKIILLKGMKTIAEFFRIDPKEVKSVIKDKRLKIKEEQDLISLCAHFSD